LAISIRNLKEDGNLVLRRTRDDGFLGLNKWKQSGLYVGVDLKVPRDAIGPEFAKAVHQFAWRALTTLDFVLKDGNLDRYIGQARDVRTKLTERGHQELERMAERMREAWFGEEPTSD
jgi:hypothetical protein